MKVPNKVEALLRHPETRAEYLRDADVSLLICGHFRPATAATSVFSFTLTVTKFPQAGEVEHECVECKDFDEIEAFLAEHKLPGREDQEEEEDE